MVHKKSEYRLQFPKLTNDIRAQIWRDNIVFRETQKRMNTSDHYWRYQLIDDECDCDDRSDMSETDLVKPVRSPHGNISKVENQLFLLQDKSVQTPDWKELMADSMPREVIESLDNKSPPSMDSPETQETSTESKSITVNPLSFETPNEDYQTSSHKLLGVNEGEHSLREKKSNIFKEKDHLKIMNCQKPDFAYSHLNLSPTRNKLKSYHSEKKTSPVFAAFGWNDSCKNIGDQKTYNIRAPMNEIHQSALLALSKRRKEIEEHFAEQLRRRRQHQSVLSIGPVNLSSIWMTEYQENFSKGQRESLRNVRHRPIVWRYT